MSDSKNTTIEIDFTGDELMNIAKACVLRNMTFSEFINVAITEAIAPYKDIM